MVTKLSVEDPCTAVFKDGDDTNINLNEIDGKVASFLRVFDKDGDGIITLAELQEAAKATKTLKKVNKLLLVAICFIVVFFGILLGSFSLIMIKLLDNNKDMNVDASTGKVTVKLHSKDAITAAVAPMEATMKSTGTMFTSDSIITDSITGNEVMCISATKASSMFENHLQGVTSKFVTTGDNNNTIEVLDVGSGGGASWNENNIDFGSFKLIPDTRCARDLMVTSETGNNDDEEHRVLSENDPYVHHRNLRDLVMNSVFNSDKNNGDYDDTYQRNLRYGGMRGAYRQVRPAGY